MLYAVKNTLLDLKIFIAIFTSESIHVQISDVERSDLLHISKIALCVKLGFCRYLGGRLPGR